MDTDLPFYLQSNYRLAQIADVHGGPPRKTRGELSLDLSNNFVKVNDRVAFIIDRYARAVRCGHTAHCTMLERAQSQRGKARISLVIR